MQRSSDRADFFSPLHRSEPVEEPLYWALFIILTSWSTRSTFRVTDRAPLLPRSTGSRPGGGSHLFAGSMLFAAILGYPLRYVPIRAAEKPAINENDPDDWDSFRMFLERKQYSDKSMFQLMFTRKGSWANQFGDFHRIGFWYHLRRQWFPERMAVAALIIPALTLLGLFAMWKRDRKVGLYFLSTLLLFTAAMTLSPLSDGTRGVSSRCATGTISTRPASS
jgi:hypothetical protein